MGYKRVFTFNSDWMKVPLLEFEASIAQVLRREKGFIGLKCWQEIDEDVPNVLPDLLIEIETEQVEDIAVIALELGLLLGEFVEEWGDFDHTTAGHDAMLADKNRRS